MILSVELVWFASRFLDLELFAQVVACRTRWEVPPPILGPPRKQPPSPPFFSPEPIHEKISLRIHMQAAIKLASAAPARHFLTLNLQLVLDHWYSISCSFIYKIFTGSGRELIELGCGRSIQRYNHNYPNPMKMIRFSVRPRHHTHRAPALSC